MERGLASRVAGSYALRVDGSPDQGAAAGEDGGDAWFAPVSRVSFTELVILPTKAPQPAKTAEMHGSPL
jgi:hypothetical protein